MIFHQNLWFSNLFSTRTSGRFHHKLWFSLPPEVTTTSGRPKNQNFWWKSTSSGRRSTREHHNFWSLPPEVTTTSGLFSNPDQKFWWNGPEVVVTSGRSVTTCSLNTRAASPPRVVPYARAASPPRVVPYARAASPPRSSRVLLQLTGICKNHISSPKNPTT